MKRLSILLLLTALLQGCVTAYTIVKPERQTVGNVISVQPGMKWNKLEYSSYQGHLEVWTLDGPQLNTLVFFTGVPDGEPLFTLRTRSPQQEEKPPVFRANMNPLEVQELLEATVARYFQTTLAESRSLQSETIAGGRGFRFETRLIGRDEVERVGIFVGTIRNKKLYGAWFQGARLNYFERYRAEVDQMIKSARLVGEAVK